MNDSAPAEHIPVLLEEVLNNLVHATAGTYVDATFGRGGHARALLDRLSADARLIALDRDPAALQTARMLAEADGRVTVRHSRLSELGETLETLGVSAVDGVLMDLGVSSPQLDDASRGFSFAKEGPLDMRMDPERGMSAAEWLNEAGEADLARVLKEYGEERYARRIARSIIAARPLSTTTELAEAVAAAVPARGASPRHPATRTFQAVRMQVNDELGEIDSGLTAAFAALAPGGRLAVISFHSLEDRRVKRFFRSLTRPAPLPRRVPVRDAARVTQAVDVVGPVAPSAAEVAANPRARSAKLRVIAKVPADER